MRRALSWFVSLVVLSAAASAQSSGEAGGPAIRGERAIEVTTPGWIVARLDGEALRFSRDDLGLIDPTGRPTLFRLRRDDGEVRKGEVIGVEEADLGWWIDIDLGPNPPRHTRLTFEVEQLAAAPGVVLQALEPASPDTGAADPAAPDGTWRELARTDLFRLGAEARFTRSTLDYPPTEARYLRLRWPRLARLPELQRVSVTGAAAVETTTELALACQEHESFDAADGAGGAMLDCRAPVPAPHRLATRVEIDLPATESPFGWRLFTVDDGRLEIAAASTRGRSRAAAEAAETLESASDPASSREPPRPLLLPLDGEARALRLVLYGTADNPPPAPIGARVQSASLDLIFRAEQAGSYRLAWGFPAGAEVPPGPQPPADATLQRLDPGAERAYAWPAPPERLAGPAAALPSGAEVLRRLPTSAGEVRPAPGDVVRLLLPPGLATRDLRLASDGRLLPFVLDDAEPTLLARGQITPSAAALGNWSSHAPLDEVWLDALEETNTLWLTADGPFERGLALLGSAQPGGDRSTLVRHTRWSCRPAPPLPCALRLDALSRSTRRPERREAVLVFDDDEDRPLAAIGLEAWGERRALRFVWPGSEGDTRPTLVRVAGSGAPRFDLEVMAPSLQARPAATLIFDSLDAPSRAPRWIGLFGLAFGAIALLWLLARLVRESKNDGAAAETGGTTERRDRTDG